MLEDLPQVAVVLGYQAAEPKLPGTYDFYLEKFCFATSIVSIFHKMVVFAWTRYTRQKEIGAECTSNSAKGSLVFAQWLFLYTPVLVTIFFAAFLAPGIQPLLYLALVLALVPNIVLFVMAPAFCCCVCYLCFNKHYTYICAPLTCLNVFYQCFMPMAMFGAIDNWIVSPVSNLTNRAASAVKAFLMPCLSAFKKCKPKAKDKLDADIKLSRRDQR